MLCNLLSQPLFTFPVCHSGGGLDGSRKAERDSTRAAQNPGSRRASSVGRFGAGQQARRQGIHVGSGNISPLEPDVHQEAQVADPSLLCTDRRRVKTLAINLL